MKKYIIQIFRTESVVHVNWFVKMIIDGKNVTLTPSIENALIIEENALDNAITNLKSCPNVIGYSLINVIER